MKHLDARASGEIEYADGHRHGVDRAEQVFRTSAHTMPPEMRARWQRRLDERRALIGQPSANQERPGLDLTTPAGKKEHVDRLLAATQADRLLEGI